MNASFTEVTKNQMKIFNTRCDNSDLSLSKSKFKKYIDCNQKSCMYSGNVGNKELPTLVNCSVDPRLQCLTVSTDSFPSKDYSHNFSGNSPLPPALSPVSSSPNNSTIHTNNQPSSPSPPVIVAEIRGSSSICSSLNSENNAYTTKLSLDNRINLSYSRPASHTLTSSSTSPSSSSSSLNETIGRVDQSANGLPIFEKISMVLGSPSSKFVETSIIKTEINDNYGQDLSIEKISETEVKASEKITEDSIPDKNNTTTDCKINKGKAPVVRRKRRSKANRLYGDSESDFEINKALGTSRGRSDARAIIQRVKQKAKTKRLSNGPGSESVGNLDIHKRYLESPFLCFCQSGCTLSDLSRQSNSLCKNMSGIKPGLTNNTSEVQDTSRAELNISAHIINPALRDLSVIQAGLSGTSGSAIPYNCPFKSTLRSDSNKEDELFGTRSIFAGINYRPSGMFRSRDFQFPSSMNFKSAWICAFCGEDNNYIDLGSLYGPYWISDVELKQLDSSLIYTSDVDCVSSGTSNELSTSTKSRRHQKSSQTTKRSNIAVRDKSSGSIRLVIKSSKEGDSKARVGSNGEVWFHLECALWAPGTYLNGNGIIGGLGEALQLALDANCSHCKKRGAILSCYSRGCNLSYHYQCAIDAGCHLNQEQFILLCKKHHIYT